MGPGVVAAGAAMAILLGGDGSLGWRVVRVVAMTVVTALVFAGMRRWDRPARGLVAVGAGVTGVAVAMGLAPHLAKGGAVWVQGATVVLAAAGVVLAVGGTMSATCDRRFRTRVGVGLAVVVLFTATAFVVGPAVAATNRPHAGLGATPAAVGLDYRDVVLETEDGVPLAAWYVESGNGAAVVLRHGAGSTRSNVLDHAVVLADAGFGVLMVDARGHGGSGGRAMDFGWHGDADIAAAPAGLAARPEVETGRIGAVGMSMGGEEALGATGTNETLRAVVAEGATARVAADEDWLSSRYGVRGVLTEQLEMAQDRVTDLLTSASTPTSLRDAVAASNARYLLIAAGDVEDEGHAAEFIAAGAPDRVQTWEVPGAGHTDGLDTAPAAWTERVVGFLNEVLVEDGGATR
jgi:dienelactone hydrolase